MEKEPITVNGLKSLKAELKDLKNIQRPKVVEAIAEARSHGDLKENAEYHAAKEQQALIESRVIAINDSIARANVIDVTKIENSGKVIFGSTVKVKDLEFKLIGSTELPLSTQTCSLNINCFITSLKLSSINPVFMLIFLFPFTPKVATACFDIS